LELLDLEAHSDVHTENSPMGMEPVCFEVPSNYEITVEGKKIIGSAQARRKEGILQHGTLPLTGDLTRITRVLNYKDEETRNQAATRLLEHATTVECITGRTVPLTEAADAFEKAFQEVLGLELIPDSLSESERQRAKELVNTKYSNSTWTCRM
jgi:lipoate-protein ligase A